MATKNQIGLSLRGSTGSGTFVGANTPTLITPNIGVATGTSLTATERIVATGGTIFSGSSSGGYQGELTLYPLTASKGYLDIVSVSNVGDYGNVLTNAATNAARTWTLPDASGTIYLVGSSLGNATATSLTTSERIVATGGTIFSGSSSGGYQGELTLYPLTASKGYFDILSVSNAGDYGNVLTNAATNGARTWTLPDASGTIALVGASLGAATATSLTFSSTSGIIGTTTNDNAAAGSVGEFVTVTVVDGSAVSLTNAVAGNITSISLSAGDWDVWGDVHFTGNTITLVQDLLGWISTTSATLPQAVLYNIVIYGATGVAVFATGSAAFNTPQIRLSLATTTTVYLSAYADFTTSTCTAFGSICARRRR